MVHVMLMFISGIGIIIAVVLLVYDFNSKNVLNAVAEVKDSDFTPSSGLSESYFTLDDKLLQSSDQKSSIKNSFKFTP